MKILRSLSLLTVTALLAAACTVQVTVGDPTTAPSETSTTADSASATTLPSSDGRVEIVGCDAAEVPTSIVCEAYDLIKTHYVDPIDDDALADAAEEALRLLDGADDEGPLVCAVPDDSFLSVCELAGTAADDTSEAAETIVAGVAAFGLDPNSGYFDPQALDLLQEEQQGEIEGIGALVSPEDQTLPGDDKQCGVVSETCEILIVSTIAGAPAEAAGLMRDDVLIAVDGESIMGWTVDEVTATVRGPSGTPVTLTVDRDGELLDITITRAAVVIPVIEQQVFDDVGYLRLWTFSGTAGAQFESAIVDLLAAGVDHLVIDLRDNPGGFLSTAIDVASVFLASGDVVVTQSPEEDLSYSVTGNAIVPEDVSVTFVVNKGSASASEVVSAALQEVGRASVVGENTFGKNTVQQRFSLSNGGALKLTIARWLTPGGHDFGGTGVTPDVEADVAGLDAEEVVALVSGL